MFVFICDILLFGGDFVSLCGCFDQLWVLFLYVHFFVLLVAVFFFIHLFESSSFCALLFLCLSLRYYTICWAMLTLCGL